jgi:hypothetical protein
MSSSSTSRFHITQRAAPGRGIIGRATSSSVHARRDGFYKLSRDGIPPPLPAPLRGCRDFHSFFASLPQQEVVGPRRVHGNTAILSVPAVVNRGAFGLVLTSPTSTPNPPWLGFWRAPGQTGNRVYYSLLHFLQVVHPYLK